MNQVSPRTIAQPPDPELLRRRFALFEMLHADTAICAPMSADDVEAVADAMDIRPHHEVVDIACGHGALLAHLAGRAGSAVGIDLSPDALDHTAAHLAAERVTARLILGDAASLPPAPSWDAVACIGASWIFHGHRGAVNASARRVRPGGVVAVGDLRARTGTAALPGVTTVEEQRQAIARIGAEVVGEVVSSTETWARYNARLRSAVERLDGVDPDMVAEANQWIERSEADAGQMEFATTIFRLGADHTGTRE